MRRELERDSSGGSGRGAASGARAAGERNDDGLIESATSTAESVVRRGQDVAREAATALTVVPRTAAAVGNEAVDRVAGPSGPNSIDTRVLNQRSTALNVASQDRDGFGFGTEVGSQLDETLGQTDEAVNRAARGVRETQVRGRAAEESIGPESLTGENIGSEISENAPGSDAISQAREGAADNIRGLAGLAREAAQNPQRNPVAAAALVGGALAEPTPVGEALLLGGASAAGVGAQASQGTREFGDTPLTTTGFVEPGSGEIETPDRPAESTDEIETPDRPAESTGEIETPEEQSSSEVDVPDDPTGSQSELAVPEPGTRRNPTRIFTSPEQIGRPTRPAQDRGQSFRRDRGASDEELDEILRGPDDVTIGESSESGSQQRDRRFPTGESAVVGRETSTDESQTTEEDESVITDPLNTGFSRAGRSPLLPGAARERPETDADDADRGTGTGDRLQQSLRAQSAGVTTGAQSSSATTSALSGQTSGALQAETALTGETTATQASTAATEQGEQTETNQPTQELTAEEPFTNNPLSEGRLENTQKTRLRDDDEEEKDETPITSSIIETATFASGVVAADALLEGFE